MLLKNFDSTEESPPTSTRDGARSLLRRIRRVWLRTSVKLDLPTRRDVRRRMHRDRLLADRTGRSFATVVFGVSSYKAAADLSTIVHVRKRETDELGPAPRQLCESLGCAVRHCFVVLLPETSRDGAARFAEAVASRMPVRPKFVVASYPHDATGDTSRTADDEAAALRRHDAPSCDTTHRFARGLPLWKRCIDLAVASVGMLLLAPLMLLVGLLVRIDSSGPALFWQARTGLGGRTFYIAKFRTMVTDAERVMAELNLRAGSEQDGPAFKLRHDPRVTRFGRLLRQTSLDELPQLWNILRGDMTLVGPRPLPVVESDACQPWQRRRLDVTPGLTCIWQVHGRSRVLFDDWMRMDLRYVRQTSTSFGVVHDFTLLAKTLPAVFLKRGF